MRYVGTAAKRGLTSSVVVSVHKDTRIIGCNLHNIV